MERMGECRRRHSSFLLPVPAGQKVTGKPGGRLSNRLKHKHDPNGKSSQLFFRVIYGELWYITITERKKHGQQRSGHGGNAGSIPAEVTNIQLRGADG